jgi:hypothetical protein
LAEAIQCDAAQTFVRAWIASPQEAARNDDLFGSIESSSAPERISHRLTIASA